MYKPTTSCGQVGLVLHNIYQQYIKYKTNGVFVEVGANDGKTGSFTYNLAKLGWKGIYCEPIPEIYNLCVENHKQHVNTICLNVGCGSKEEELEITVANTLSTIDNEMLEMYKKSRWAQSTLQGSYKTKIKIEKLDVLLKENSISPDFDVFILDVEGYEEEVLKGFSLDYYKPKIIVIEIPDEHPDFISNSNFINKCKRIRKTLNSNYKLVLKDIVDNVYIRNDIL
jgi:FkbM family methyltransferase